MISKYFLQHFHLNAIIATIGITVLIQSCDQSPKKSNSIQTFKAPKINEPELPTYNEELVMFPGGNEGFSKFISDNIVYKKGNVRGKVLAGFTIDKKGNLTDIKIIRGLNPIIDNEVIRVLKLSPKWQPEKINGKPGESRMTIPISFSDD